MIVNSQDAKRPGPNSYSRANLAKAKNNVHRNYGPGGYAYRMYIEDVMDRRKDYQSGKKRL